MMPDELRADTPTGRAVARREKGSYRVMQPGGESFQLHRVKEVMKMFAAWGAKSVEAIYDVRQFQRLELNGACGLGGSRVAPQPVKIDQRPAAPGAGAKVKCRRVQLQQAPWWIKDWGRREAASNRRGRRGTSGRSGQALAPTDPLIALVQK